MSTSSKPMRKRIINAAAWGYAGVAGKLIIQLGSQIVLARALGPETYGIFAIAAIIVGLSNFFADAGIGAVLVQREEINDQLVEFVQTCQWIAGLIVCALLVLASPLIATFFNEPRAVDLLRVMSVVCLLSAAASVPSNLLKRRLDFKSLQLAQLVGFFVGYVLLGIPCALMGFGVWSLAIAWIAQAAINATILLNLTKPRFRFRLSVDGRSNVLSFGIDAFISNIFTWAGTNVDKAIVGRYYSTSDLGVYNVANNLLSTAVAQVLSTLQAVLFSATSRSSSDFEQTRRTFLTVLEAGAVILLPVFICIAASPSYVLIGIYGEKWSLGAELMSPIAITMCMYGLSGIVTPLFWSINRVDVEGKIQMAGTILIVLAGVGIAMNSMSVVTLGWVVATCVAVRSITTIVCIANILKVGLGSVTFAVTGGLVVAAASAAFSHELCNYLHQELGIKIQTTLAVAVPPTILVILISTYFVAKCGLLPSVVTLVKKVSSPTA